MIYKVLAFHRAFDVMEESLNRWALDGWRVLAAWQQDYTITIIMERADDPPEVDPDDAEAQRIAETYADAADELARIEAEDAAADRMAEAWIFGPRDMPLDEDGT